MKLKLLTAAATAALMAVPTVAQADDHEYDKGWYLRGNVGYGVHTDQEFTGDLVGDVESEGNFAGSLGVGYDWGDNWRAELDLTSLWTDMGKIQNQPNSYAKLRTTTVMLNLLYDFDSFGKWQPYVGGGLGYARGDLDAEAHDFAIAPFINPAAGGNFHSEVHNSSGSFAWQVLAGIGYEITDNLTWDTHYRYQDMGDMTFNTESYSTLADFTSGPAYGFQGKTNLDDVGAHVVMTGLRYRFGKSAPMVTCWDGSSVKMIGDCPVEPKIISCWDGSSFEEGKGECPARPVYIDCWDGSQVEEGVGTCPAQPTYVCWDNSVVFEASQCPVSDRGNDLVSLCGSQYRQEIIYYEFDKGQSPETRATIGRILDVGEYCNVNSIQVVGHTDTSGAASYNLALSQRRAKDAKDELVRQGISSSIISSEGKGETEPFIPTGDGVKEQLNRRTEVLITLSEVGVITN